MAFGAGRVTAVPVAPLLFGRGLGAAMVVGVDIEIGFGSGAGDGAPFLTSFWEASHAFFSALRAATSACLEMYIGLLHLLKYMLV